MNAHELDAMMVKVFGPDYRDKTVGGWPLADCFDECGLHDPSKPLPGSLPQGLWGWSPLPSLADLSLLSVADQVKLLSKGKTDGTEGTD